MVGLQSPVAGVKYGSMEGEEEWESLFSKTVLLTLEWDFHEIAIINTTFTQTLREEGKKKKKTKHQNQERNVHVVRKKQSLKCVMQSGFLWPPWPKHFWEHETTMP